MWEISTTEKQVQVPPSHRWLNITGLVSLAIADSGIAEGFVIIQTKHTTTGLSCGLLVQEDEKGLMQDLLCLLDKVVPAEGCYTHDDFAVRTENLGPDERQNAAAHLKAAFLQSSLTLVFKARQLQLGQWQSVLLFDFDPVGRPFRTLNIQVCGTK